MLFKLVEKLVFKSKPKGNYELLLLVFGLLTHFSSNKQSPSKNQTSS